MLGADGTDRWRIGHRRLILKPVALSRRLWCFVLAVVARMAGLDEPADGATCRLSSPAAKQACFSLAPFRNLLTSQ